MSDRLAAVAYKGHIEFNGDKTRSPLAEKVVIPMPNTPEADAARAALQDHWKEWLADCKAVAPEKMMVRMTKANM